MLGADMAGGVVAGIVGEAQRLPAVSAMHWPAVLLLCAVLSMLLHSRYQV